MNKTHEHTHEHTHGLCLSTGGDPAYGPDQGFGGPLIGDGGGRDRGRGRRQGGGGEEGEEEVVEAREEGG